MSDQTRAAAERIVLLLMLVLATLVVAGLGGLVFVGILQGVSGKA
jgi:hypothetical protein